MRGRGRNGTATGTAGRAPARALSSPAALTYWLSAPHAAANRLVVAAGPPPVHPRAVTASSAAAAITGDDRPLL